MAFPASLAQLTNLSVNLNSLATLALPADATNLLTLDVGVNKLLANPFGVPASAGQDLFIRDWSRRRGRLEIRTG